MSPCCLTVLAAVRGKELVTLIENEARIQHLKLQIFLDGDLSPACSCDYEATVTTTSPNWQPLGSLHVPRGGVGYIQLTSRTSGLGELKIVRGTQTTGEAGFGFRWVDIPKMGTPASTERSWRTKFGPEGTWLRIWWRFPIPDEEQGKEIEIEELKRRIANLEEAWNEQYCARCDPESETDERCPGCGADRSS